MVTRTGGWEITFGIPRRQVKAGESQDDLPVHLCSPCSRTEADADLGVTPGTQEAPITYPRQGSSGGNTENALPSRNVHPRRKGDSAQPLKEKPDQRGFQRQRHRYPGRSEQPLYHSWCGSRTRQQNRSWKALRGGCGRYPKRFARR